MFAIIFMSFFFAQNTSWIQKELENIQIWSLFKAIIVWMTQMID